MNPNVAKAKVQRICLGKTGNEHEKKGTGPKERIKGVLHVIAV